MCLPYSKMLTAQEENGLFSHLWQNVSLVSKCYYLYTVLVKVDPEKEVIDIEDVKQAELIYPF